MPTSAIQSPTARSTIARMSPPSRVGDKVFGLLTLAMALAVVALVFLVGWQLACGSAAAIEKFGFRFVTGSTWDPVAENFGALPFIYGTAVFSLIEMLAAIPSVILGLWGIFVMIPWLRSYAFPLLKKIFGWTPLFSGPIYGVSMLAGGIIIAIMILPIVTSVSREILRSVPNLQREAAYALGATRWEVTRIAVLSY